MKKNIKELDIVDLDDIVQAVEQHSVEIENNFIKLYTDRAEE